MKTLISGVVIALAFGTNLLHAATWPQTLAKEGFTVGWESDGRDAKPPGNSTDVKVILDSLTKDGYVVTLDEKNIQVTPKNALTNVICSFSSKGGTLVDAIKELTKQTGVPIFPMFLRKSVSEKKVDVSFEKLPLNKAFSKIAQSAGFSVWTVGLVKSEDGGRSFYTIEFL